MVSHHFTHSPSSHILRRTANVEQTVNVVLDVELKARKSKSKRLLKAQQDVNSILTNGQRTPPP